MTHPAASTRTFLIPLAFLVGAMPGAAQNHLAITPVTVIDVTDGSVRSNQTVLVRSNRITAVGPVDEVTVPKQAEKVDGADGYLIPGLWDMHVHSVANIAVDTPIDSVAAWEWHLPLFLAHGVTGVRNMNDGAGDLTLELANSVKRRLTERELAGPPRYLNSGPSLDGYPPLASNAVVVRSAADAQAAVAQLASHGADLVKPYENLSREAYFAIVDEARRQGLPVDGHAPFRVTPEEAAGAGQRTVEHPDGLAAGCSTAAEAERERFDRILSGYDRLSDAEKFLAQFRYYRALYDSWDPAACTSMIEAYRRNGVALAADLVTYHHVVHAQRVLSDTDSMRLVPRAIRRNWEAGLDSETIRKFRSILRPIIPLQAEQVRLFNEAGGTLLAATDVGVPWQVPGISLHEELALLVEAGLTPLEALGAATLNPARVLGLVDSLGTVEVGKLADLVLLEANPLEDITNTQRIRAVVADGRLYRRAELDRLLAEVEASDEGAALRTLRDVAYVPDPHPEQRLDFYWPPGASATVLFVHGGSLKESGERRSSPEYQDICPTFAAAGIGCATVDYRLFPSFSWPAMAEDVAAAVAKVRGLVEEEGGNPGRVVLFGHSSGCQLAAVLGANPVYLAGVGLEPGDLAGVVAMGCVLDNYDAALRGLTAERIAAAFAENPDERARWGSAEGWIAANPSYHLGAHMPPTLVLVAEGERFFPPLLEQGARFVRRLLEFDVPADLVVVPGTHRTSIEGVGDARDPVFEVVRSFVLDPSAVGSE